jgi:hypothetical protein
MKEFKSKVDDKATLCKQTCSILLYRCLNNQQQPTTTTREQAMVENQGVGPRKTMDKIKSKKWCVLSRHLFGLQELKDSLYLSDQ